MYEHKTVDYIRDQALAEVADDVDKREGAIIFDATAAVATPMAEMYSDIDIMYRLTFADTADGEYLERRVNEHGVKKKKASKAIRKGIFLNTASEPLIVPEGFRFRLGDQVYKILESNEPGMYQLKAETPGSVGNQDYGELLPLEPLEGLASATLTDVIIPGEDEESDESLYEKYLEHINEPAFGGNRADYKRTILAIPGVGGVRLTRVPYGGGTVRATIIDSDFNIPTPELIATVKEIVDPIGEEGEGYGTAPIGHTVYIGPVPAIVIDITLNLTVEGVTLGQIEPFVQQVIDDFLLEIRMEWKKEKALVLRISHLETRILAIEGVVDITGTTLNGLPENIILPTEIPIKGSVTINE